MPRHVDALTSPTLKDLRERWWDNDFSDFLRETLRPRPGTRILDVGCGEGTAEISLGRLQISQVSLYAVDRRVERAQMTASIGAAHNIKVHVAAADAVALPFADACFDSTFCVAVLQHVQDVPRAVGELARVTKPGGRVVAVEPDNAARYWFSSLPSGQRAYELGARFFSAAGQARGETLDASVGPKLPGIFAGCGLEPLWVTLYPVSVTRMGPPPSVVWDGRLEAVERILQRSSGDGVRALAGEYVAQLETYKADAAAAGRRFVEIQNTMLFATVGQKGEAGQ
jgi:SAM-dependent methyltransferase